MVSLNFHGKEDLNTDSKVELFMKVNGSKIIEMDVGYKFGLMEQNMKVIGRIIRHVVKVNFIM